MYPFEALTHKIIAAAIEVHKNLGPGLLESIYQNCLEWEFDHRRLNYQKELDIPLSYRERKLNQYLTIDFLVENEVIVELKAVDVVLPVHEAQLLSYMRLANKQVGLLINFNVHTLKHGIRRRILSSLPVLK